MCQQRRQQAGGPAPGRPPPAGGEVTAGIPVSSELVTAAGRRLLDCLTTGDPAQFVPLVSVELQQVP